MAAHLPPRDLFTPVDISLWVRLDLDGTGRWSAYLWGADEHLSHHRESAQFDGPIRGGEVLVNAPVPQWVLNELATMLAEAHLRANRIIW